MFNPTYIQSLPVLSSFTPSAAALFAVNSSLCLHLWTFGMQNSSWCTCWNLIAVRSWGPPSASPLGVYGQRATVTAQTALYCIPAQHSSAFVTATLLHAEAGNRRRRQEAGGCRELDRTRLRFPWLRKRVETNLLTQTRRSADDHVLHFRRIMIKLYIPLKVIKFQYWSCQAEF